MGTYQVQSRTHCLCNPAHISCATQETTNLHDFDVGHKFLNTHILHNICFSLKAIFQAKNGEWGQVEPGLKVGMAGCCDLTKTEQNKIYQGSMSPGQMVTTFFLQALINFSSLLIRMTWCSPFWKNIYSNIQQRKYKFEILYFIIFWSMSRDKHKSIQLLLCLLKLCLNTFDLCAKNLFWNIKFIWKRCLKIKLWIK